MQRRQSPRRTTSAEITASTAASASVNRAASCGGSRPEAAQRLRRSMLASVRGREPTHLLAGAGEAAGAFLASIRADSASASASVTLPAANAFQSNAATSGSFTRGAASTARRISSANIVLGPSRAAARVQARLHRLGNWRSRLTPGGSYDVWGAVTCVPGHHFDFAALLFGDRGAVVVFRVYLAAVISPDAGS